MLYPEAMQSGKFTVYSIVFCIDRIVHTIQYSIICVFISILNNKCFTVNLCSEPCSDPVQACLLL